jgi:transposase
MNTYYIGIDLHSDNLQLAMIDQNGKRRRHRRLSCDLEAVLELIQPEKRRLKTIAIESTFNWYWLVDGLQNEGYPVVLANPAQMPQYRGLKHSADEDDAWWLAEMARLDILPTGYIYPRQTRAVRDLLRRRLLLVRQRTTLLLSFKGLFARNFGSKLPLARLKQMEPSDGRELFEQPGDQIAATAELELIAAYDRQIQGIERKVLAQVKKQAPYRRLQTLPGIGVILGMTIALESGDITRFKGPGNYASYCRAVPATRLSNDKTKGRNNGKSGNKYLAWAFVEAAHCAKRHHADCARFFDRKKQQRNTSVATKALAAKLAKAAWWVMKENTDYDPRRMFGS